MKSTCFISCIFLVPSLILGRRIYSFSALPPVTEAYPLSSPSPSVLYGGVIASKQNQHMHNGYLGAIFIALILVLLTLLSIWFYRRKYIKHTGPSEVRKFDGPALPKLCSTTTTIRRHPVAMFEYSLLESATDCFNENNILSEGGYCDIYRAQLDGDVFAAVKKVDNVGPDFEKEFQNELELMSVIQHPNILPLLGYCIHGGTRFIISEFCQNGSLEMQLHGPSGGSHLTWHIRMKIALDVARGLEYLHERCNPPVIHRNIKSSSILLDSKFNAKVSDFSHSVAAGSHKGNGFKVLSAHGYVPPEYLLDGKVTEKSDVYAFGIVLLELLMGRKPIEKMTPSQCQSIVTWAMPQLTDRLKLPTMVDPVVRNTTDLKHLYQVAAVAVLCVQPEPSYRPLITDVLHSLIPLVPVELGGTLKNANSVSYPRTECPN